MNRRTAMLALLVDDNQFLLESSAQILECAGFTVRPAISGEEAVGLAAVCQPQIAVMDIQLPGINGFAAMKAIREIKGLEKLPALFISGALSSKEKFAELDIPYSSFLLKPFKGSKLIEAARALLPRAGADAQPESANGRKREPWHL